MKQHKRKIQQHIYLSESELTEIIAESDRTGESINETIIKNAINQIRYLNTHTPEEIEKRKKEQSINKIFKYELNKLIKNTLKEKLNNKEVYYLTNRLTINDTYKTIESKIKQIKKDVKITSYEIVIIVMFIEYYKAQANGETIQDESQDEYITRTEQQTLKERLINIHLSKLTKDQQKKYNKWMLKHDKQTQQVNEEWEKLINKIREN